MKCPRTYLYTYHLIKQGCLGRADMLQQFQLVWWTFSGAFVSY